MIDPDEPIAFIGLEARARRQAADRRLGLTLWYAFCAAMLAGGIAAWVMP